VNIAKPGNAQIHHVRVFKQYERHEVRPGAAREPGGVFVNGDLAEVAARWRFSPIRFSLTGAKIQLGNLRGEARAPRR
jgi:hypothetical protein